MWNRTRPILLLKQFVNSGFGQRFASSSIRIRPKYRLNLDDPKQRFTSLPNSVMSNKLLVAFDFDKTIIGVNSDTFILQALPEGGKEADAFTNLQWTQYMQKVFDLLHKSGARARDIFSYLERIPFTPGMPELLSELHTNGHEAIIISDCNKIFIDYVLRKNNMQHLVKKVFTNPSYFDKDDHLHVNMFHQQNWCQLCSVNLCKGHVLKEYIDLCRKEGTEFKTVAYIGDGLNDVCPMLTLKPNDLAFPRVDFPCHKAIVNGKERERKLLAKMFPWKDAFQIKEVLFVETDQ